MIDPSGALRDDDLPQPSGGSARETPAEDRVPRLVKGVELIGEYKDSGFRDTPYLARRADGQVVQLSKLLFAVAEKIDGRRPIGTIAAEVTREQERKLSPDNVAFLVSNKLVPLGVSTLEGVPGPRLKRFDPMLALKFKTAVVPEGAVKVVSSIFRPLFWPPVVVAVLLTLVGLDVWVLFIHGVAQSFRELLLHPTTMLVVMALIVASAGFHECGHATACRYGGATPGVIGAGIYIVWPAFYSDVTDAYRLGKGARLRTDLGGVYFNVVFMLVVAGLYFATHFEPLLILVFAQHIEIAHQFLPFLRLDGYYVVADITGVPDLFGRIKPILAHLVLRRPADKAVQELKPWVRRVVTGWVLLTVPVVAYIYLMLVVHAPRILGTAWASISTLGAGAAAAISHGQPVPALLDAVQILLLGVPTVGLIASFAMSGKQLGTYVWKNTEGRPVRRSLAMAVATVLGALLVISWMPPRGNYTPIQPGERGIVPDRGDRYAARASSAGAAAAAAGAAHVAGDVTRGHAVPGLGRIPGRLPELCAERITKRVAELLAVGSA